MEAIKERQIITMQLLANSYIVREDNMDGKPHIIVPVTMMVEGVHNGSHGPILHTAEELGKWTEAWDGIPVTLTHPRKDNKNVSANDPEVLDDAAVGRVFHTHYDGGLKAEAWIDADKISKKSPETHAAILNGETMEVSVGVFNDIVTTEGEWNGETYEVMATNYRPDHLALLPEEVGACSVEDGCGLRANKEGGVEVKDVFSTFEQLSQKGYVVSLISNEKGFREIQSALSAKLSDLNKDGVYHYVEEVFDDYVIYSSWDDAGGGETLYKQKYDIDADENIVFDGMRSVVRKNVEYITMEKKRATISDNNLNKGGQSMTDKGSLCCEAKVDALIANKQTHWQATDREWLLTQSEATIAKMSPMAPEAEEQSAEEIQANNEAVIADYKASRKTIADYTEGMPEDMKAIVDAGVELYNERKATLIKSIMDNTAEGVWEEDTLKEMDDSTLEKVSKSVKQPADYSGQAAGEGGSPATDGEQVELPVEYAERKEDK